MILCSMTATFREAGRRDPVLFPRLNLIPPPPTSGEKSTWCAFLLAMLYGIDTRQQAPKLRF